MLMLLSVMDMYIIILAGHHQGLRDITNTKSSGGPGDERGT